MINLTPDEIIAIGKANLAKNVCDLAFNEIFGLSQCKNSWSKELLRFLVLDAYDKCPGRQAMCEISINYDPFDISYELEIIDTTSNIVFNINNVTNPATTLTEIVAIVNDMLIGIGFIMDEFEPLKFRIYAPTTGKKYNGYLVNFSYQGSLKPFLATSGALSGGLDTVSQFDQKTIDCYYSVLNT